MGFVEREGRLSLTEAALARAYKWCKHRIDTASCSMQSLFGEIWYLAHIGKIAQLKQHPSKWSLEGPDFTE